MKQYIIPFILFIILIIGACKKECPNPQKQINSKYKGKVKSLKEYTEGGDTTLYYFYYDSLTGDLLSSSRKYYGTDIPSNDTITNTSYIYVYDDTTIYIRYSRNASTYIDKIIVHGKQIVAEYRHDTITNTDINITTTFINIDNKVDSITDIGFGPVYDISYGSFAYDNNNNCIHYSSYWTDLLMGYPANNSLNYAFTFTTLRNTNMLHWQTPCNIIGNFDQAGNFNESTYSLGINGYYVVQPNTYLIDSALYSETNAYAKYNYIFTNGNITNVSIKLGASGVPITQYYYQEYTYY